MSVGLALTHLTLELLQDGLVALVSMVNFFDEHHSRLLIVNAEAVHDRVSSDELVEASQDGQVDDNRDSRHNAPVLIRLVSQIRYIIGAILILRQLETRIVVALRQYGAKAMTQEEACG